MAKTPKESDSTKPSRKPPSAHAVAAKSKKRDQGYFDALRAAGARDRSKEYDDPKDLPRWAKMAMVETELLGTKQADAAKKQNRSAGQLSKYCNSPAGLAWRAEVRKIADDPVALAGLMIRSSIHSVTAEYLAALDSAIGAGDYKEVGVMSRDLLDRMGVTKKKDADTGGKTAIVINLQTASLDVPKIHSSYLVEGDDDDVEEASFVVVDEESDDS